MMGAMTRRLALALAAAVTAVAAAALVVALVGRDPRPPTLSSKALPAEALIDSIGVVVHFHYADTPYGRRDDVVARLRELGVRHIREGMPEPTGPLADGLRAARAAGIRASVGTGEIDVDPQQAVANSLDVMGGSIDSFEGPNELDNSGDPDWPGTLRAYMPRLAAAVREQAPGVPLIGPSFIDPLNRDRIPRDLPGAFNGHPYSGGEPPEPALERALSERRATARGRAAYFTETGYHNALAATTGQPPASEQAAAIYIPRLLVTAFGAGVRRTYVYELLDEQPDPELLDPEWHFGLLRNDLSPKPAFTAVRTLIAALGATPGGRSRGPLAWSLDTDGEQVERLQLVRADGSRVIALWRAVSVWDQHERHATDPGRARVELFFGGLGGRDVEVWRPSVSDRPVLRRERARRLALQLEGDLVLVSLH